MLRSNNRTRSQRCEPELGLLLCYCSVPQRVTRLPPKRRDSYLGSLVGPFGPFQGLVVLEMRREGPAKASKECRFLCGQNVGLKRRGKV